MNSKVNKVEEKGQTVAGSCCCPRNKLHQFPGCINLSMNTQTFIKSTPASTSCLCMPVHVYILSPVYILSCNVKSILFHLNALAFRNWWPWVGSVVVFAQNSHLCMYRPGQILHFNASWVTSHLHSKRTTITSPLRDGKKGVHVWHLFVNAADDEESA